MSGFDLQLCGCGGGGNLDKRIPSINSGGGNLDKAGYPSYPQIPQFRARFFRHLSCQSRARICEKNGRGAEQSES